MDFTRSGALRIFKSAPGSIILVKKCARALGLLLLDERQVDIEDIDADGCCQFRQQVSVHI